MGRCWAAVLSLLTGMVLDVGELCIFYLDVALVPPAGVAVDLGHLERQCAVEGYVVEVGKNPVGHFEECQHSSRSADLDDDRSISVQVGAAEQHGLTTTCLSGVLRSPT